MQHLIKILKNSNQEKVIWNTSTIIQYSTKLLNRSILIEPWWTYQGHVNVHSFIKILIFIDKYDNNHLNSGSCVHSDQLHLFR